MPVYKHRISKNLRRMIRQSGFSAEKVAFGSGVSKSALSNYMSGKRIPSIHALELIAEHLKRDFMDFFK
ncbi:MAG TPA: helix-turn-helix transcriptional regulator [bacterium]|nr:helix-turn-helix transcriptional regulator [bacterium]